MPNPCPPARLGGGAARPTPAKGKRKTHKELLAAGDNAQASVLQNVDSDTLVNKALPQAQEMQLDTQANAIQALDSGRADAAAIATSALTPRLATFCTATSTREIAPVKVPLGKKAAPRSATTAWSK